MFPRSDGILLGGTHENGVWSLEPDPAARRRILDGHRQFFDSYRRCGPSR
jgi:D-amino-acid oxidase